MWGFGNRFEGKVQNATTANVGTRATAVYRFGALCFSDTNPGTNFNTEWAMLREVGNGDAYMQSGYLRSFGGCSRLFTEHDRDGPLSGVFPFRRVLSACTSATQTHSVYFDSGCLCSRLGYAFVVMDTTEYNIYQEWSPTRSDWLAEALYAESDIPGLLGSESALQALQIQPVFGNSFQANPTALADVHAVGRWHQGPLFFNSFLLWTNPQ